MHRTHVDRAYLLVYRSTRDLSRLPLSLVLPLEVLLVQLEELCSGPRGSHFASCEEELRDQRRSVASCQRSVGVDFGADQVGIYQLNHIRRLEPAVSTPPYLEQSLSPAGDGVCNARILACTVMRPRTFVMSGNLPSSSISLSLFATISALAITLSGSEASLAISRPEMEIRQSIEREDSP